MYTPNGRRERTRLKTVEDVAMKAARRAVTIATAGVGSSGYYFIEQFKVAAGVTYRHVPYAGGAPAVVAVASGETEMVPQLSIEVAELLRSGKLRALAVSTNEPLIIEGYGTISSVTKAVPKFEDYGSYFGLMAPRDPEERVGGTARLQKAAALKAVKDYATTKGGIAIAISGEKADQLVERLARKEAWIARGWAGWKNPADLKIKA
jgi:tripartite-type tricarboxylate transporter receptor subunit TctC